MNVAKIAAAIEQPFPGLRPFERSESLLFFGREQHVTDLLRSLRTSHFIAVVGASGSGKSSLVRAGLLPALYRGYLVDATSHWRIAIMRPGNAPVSNLCRALTDADALGPTGDERLAALSASSMGLVEVVQHSGLKDHENLLIVVDQFEELFRYRRQAQLDDGGAEAALFVSLLLEAVERIDNVYVVLTMRSDFLGECSQFTGLAEILSQSQFLIPRLNRDQRQDAIERPLRLAGASISARLVQQLLNDSGDEVIAAASLYRGTSPDPLPLLQHALMRMFQHWKDAGRNADLDLANYEAVGGMQRALDRHAEAIYNDLDPAAQVTAEKVFRTLTTTELGLPVRRPTRLSRLCEIVGCESVDHVLRLFLDRSNSLLVSTADADPIVDIPHESLIWKWDRLKEWVRKEAASANLYVDLANDVLAHKEGKAALWRDPNLKHILQLQAADGWNEPWASQYQSGPPPFAETQDFLQESHRVLRNERWMRRGAVVVVLVLLVVAGLLFTRQRRAEENARAIQGQLEQIKKEQDEAQSKVQQYQTELDRAKADFATSSSKLSDEERAKREKAIAELQTKLETSEQAAKQLQLEQQRTAKLAATNADVASLNQTLEDRVAQLQTRVSNLEKERQESVGRANGLQEKLDSATRESGHLKLRLHEAGVDPRELLTLRGHRQQVNDVAYSGDGRYIATGSRDRTARLWDATNGKEILTLGGHEAGVVSVAFNHDGSQLATVSLGHAAKVWDAKNGKLQTAFRGQVTIMYSAMFHPAGRLLATGGEDHSAWLWDVQNGQAVRSFRGHTSQVVAVAFSPDGKHLATASHDRTTKLWDVDSGKQLTSLGHATIVDEVAFSPDGRILVTVADQIRFWDVATLVYWRSVPNVAKFAFSPDGSRWAAGHNNAMSIREVVTGKELLLVPLPQNALPDLAFSPDGLRLVTSGGPANTAVVWDVSSTAPKR